MMNSDELEVAIALADEMNERIVQLIQRLANKTSVPDIRDEELNSEVREVRTGNLPS